MYFDFTSMRTKSLRGLLRSEGKITLKSLSIAKASFFLIQEVRFATVHIYDWIWLFSFLVTCGFTYSLFILLRTALNLFISSRLRANESSLSNVHFKRRRNSSDGCFEQSFAPNQNDSSPTKRLMSVQAMRFSINSIYFHYLNCTEGSHGVITTPWAVNSQTNLCIKMFYLGKKVLIQWPTWRDYLLITCYFRHLAKIVIHWNAKQRSTNKQCLLDALTLSIFVCLYVSIFKSLLLNLTVEKDKQGRNYW